MIVELIVTPVVILLNSIFSLLPSFDNTISLDSNIVDFIIDLFQTINFFIPLGAQLGILLFKVAINNWFIFYKIILRIWDAIPFI